MKFQNGKDLTVDTFEKNGFNRPILITNKEGLGMTVPDKNFSVMDVERCVGMLAKNYKWLLLKWEVVVITYKPITAIV